MTMIGTVLGKYRLLRKVGEGGMGGVYEAQHTSTGRRVAVKILKETLAADVSIVERFGREARAAGAIESEHVAHILDFGRDEATGHAYLAMEFLDGEDVGKLAARLSPVPPDLALRIAAQACAGLQRAHEAGIVHRDIKATNIFAAHRDEGAVTIKILDFGIAKVEDAELSAGFGSLTQTGGMVGTPHYMSPEQFRNSKNVDHRTDIWSLGIVLYQLLTGHLPTEGAGSVGEILFQLITVGARPVQDYAPWVPPEASTLVHRALRTDPNDRFQSVSLMLEAIKPLLPGGRAISLDMFVPLTLEQRDYVAPRAPDLRTPPGLPDKAAALMPTVLAQAGTSISGSNPGMAPTPAAAAPGPAGRPLARSPVALMVAFVLVMMGFTAVAVWRFTRPAGAPARSPGGGGDATLAAASSVIDAERLESFGPLPQLVTRPDNPLGDAKIALGRMLFFEPRLSRNQDVSCTTCHPLDRYGVDGKQFSAGHAQQLGARNAPTVYNAAGATALMWDGRAANVEDQVMLPITNPVEMNMTPGDVEERLKAIPGYVEAFGKAFPDDPSPVNFANVARAIGAFERRLFTPSRWERFLAGERNVITDQEKSGFNTFVEVGCPTCHFGPYVGGNMFQKLGLVKAWPYTRDRGRYELTHRNEDYMVFRVPTLRNIARTAPYLHDGSRTSLTEVVKLMAHHQVGKEISDAQAVAIVAWLGALTGDLPTAYIQKPTLP
jgi:cytochrome c peroxidase